MEVDIGMACAEYAKYLSDTFWYRQIIGFAGLFIVLAFVGIVWYLLRKKWHEDFNE